MFQKGKPVLIGPFVWPCSPKLSLLCIAHFGTAEHCIPIQSYLVDSRKKNVKFLPIFTPNSELLTQATCARQHGVSQQKHAVFPSLRNACSFVFVFSLFLFIYLFIFSWRRKMKNVFPDSFFSAEVSCFSFQFLCEFFSSFTPDPKMWGLWHGV